MKNNLYDNSIDTTISLDNGSDLIIKIVGEHWSKKAYGLKYASQLSFWYKDGELAGDMHFSPDKASWEYKGRLSHAEATQLADFIINFDESDWDT